MNKTFESRKNIVELTNNGNILKKFRDSVACKTEATTLAILDGKYAPRLLLYDNNWVEMTFIQGDLLLNKYLAADSIKASVLAEMLAETVINIYNITDKKITYDENFRNYIVDTTGIVRIDFEETREGSIESWCAKLMAFSSLYDVSDTTKIAFATTLVNNLAVSKDILFAEYEKELRYLAARWTRSFPTKLFTEIENSVWSVSG